MRIKVRALANVIGLVRGDEVYVECGEMVDGLIAAELLAWIDPPAPTFEQYEVTEVVKQRAKRAREESPGTEEILSSDPAPDPFEVWEHEGGGIGEPL